MRKISSLVRIVALCSLAPMLCQAAGDYPMTLGQGSRLFVSVRINGTPTVALLDSAAEATFIDRSFAARLKLEDPQAVTARGSGKEAFDAGLVKGVTLEAVGLTLGDQTVAIADLADVGRRLLGKPLDVILGRELFDAARLSIDIEHQRIGVADRSLDPPGVRLALQTEHGIETIPARVEDGPAIRATFDLGNGSAVLVSAAFAERQGFLKDGRKVGHEQGGGLGGETTRETFTLRSLEIAGQRFTDVPAAIDAHENSSDINVGVSILRHFHITTDYSARAVWLEPISR